MLTNKLSIALMIPMSPFKMTIGSIETYMEQDGLHLCYIYDYFSQLLCWRLSPIRELDLPGLLTHWF